MKQIYNYNKATVSDVEADGLLDEATKLHVISCELASGKRVDIIGDDFKVIRKFIKHHLDNEIPVIGHNFICYDIPLLEKITGYDLSKLMVIDTLILSWYLNIDREKHGLDSFHEDYGIKKPPITDWVGLSYEEYRYRCQEDVNINKALWNDLKARLQDMYTTVKESIDSGEVDSKRIDPNEVLYIDSLKGLSVEDHINRLLTFLMYKGDTMRLREDTRILIDQGLLHRTDVELEGLCGKAAEELQAVMPLVPQYSPKNYPAKPRLTAGKDKGKLSASGKSWNEAIKGLTTRDDLGNFMSLEVEGDPDKLKVLKGYAQPNINSPSQIKDWLFSKGWKPKTFKFVKDKAAQQLWVDSGFKKELKPKPRAVPQLSVDEDEGKELCPSVLLLGARVPEIKAYSGYTLLKHRYDVIQGFKNSISEDGYVKAEIGGLANTLREKHRKPITNLPNPKKLYGEKIRGLLTCEEEEILSGSDVSSLEDNIKNNFCMAYDPEYVKSVNLPNYDPHLKMAIVAGFITDLDQAFYKWYKDGVEDSIKGLEELKLLSKQEQMVMIGRISVARANGKTTNYASVYGAAPDTIARESGMPLKDAKVLHTAYWKIHWYVKAIAEDQFTFYCGMGNRWLINPINGFCYSIRSEKDIFSTLIQGTGSYLFDMWINNMIELLLKQFGEANLMLLMHDEEVIRFIDSVENRDIVTKLTNKAMSMVNKEFKLRIPLKVDTQFGKRYSEIH